MARRRKNSTYEWWIEGNAVLVVDLDCGRSVTNDAEGVIADLAAAGVDFRGRRVLYRDTTGRWDQLVVAGGAFSGFAPGTRADQEWCPRALAARIGERRS
jgi:hypothetical protein